MRSRLDRATDERAHELKSQGEIGPDVDISKLAQEAHAEILRARTFGALSGRSLGQRDRGDALRRRDRTPWRSARGCRAGILQRRVAPPCPPSALPRCRRALGERPGRLRATLRDGSRLWAVWSAAAPTGLLVIQKPRRIGATLEELVRTGDDLPRHRHVPRPVRRLPAPTCSWWGRATQGTTAIVAALAAARPRTLGWSCCTSSTTSRRTERMGPRSSDARRGADRFGSARPRRRSCAGRAIGGGADERRKSPRRCRCSGRWRSRYRCCDARTDLRRALARLWRRMSLRCTPALPGARTGMGGATFDVVVEVGRLRDSRLRVLRVAELAGVAATRSASRMSLPSRWNEPPPAAPWKVRSALPGTCRTSLRRWRAADSRSRARCSRGRRRGETGMAGYSPPWRTRPPRD